MPSILVVEHEGRYIERIQDALSAEGWRPRFVAGRPEALRAAASEAPNLVLVNAELPGAPELLRSFARSQGGPGAVALLGEGGGGEGLVADEFLSKPFSDQDLRLMVRRRLVAAEKGSAPPPPRGAASTGEPDDDHKLTSQEIFGDLLAEVESEVAAGEAVADEAPAAPAVSAPPRPTHDDDVERRLERTLSGVPGLSRRHRATTSATTGRSPADPPPPHREPPDAPGKDEPGRQEPPPRVPPEPPRREPPPAGPPQGDPPPRRTSRSLRRTDDDVDELLNMTLSGLALDSRGAPRRTAPPAATGTGGKPRPAKGRTAEIDLAELEALAGRSRRRSTTPAPPSTTPAPPDTTPAPPDTTADRPAGTPPAGAAQDERAGEASAAAAEAPAATAGPASSPAPRDEPPPVEAAAQQGAAATTAPAEGDGRRFGHYRLLERIAVGGMAEVWKARMSGVEGFQKTVAIKRILPHMNDDSDFVDMFIDEAKLAAQLNHPNITHIYDLGKIGDDYYIAMEYVDGRNLRAILNESRRKALKLPVGFALVVAARLASALDYAHRKRDFDDRDLELVHRDVSPQNVLISTDGDIKLCDFGISKAVAKLNQTETGALKGKLQYMSPEQAWGRKVDARSDLFSLGALTFEMLTGERLFTGDSEISVLEAVRECRVRRPQQVEPTVPPALEAVVLKALEREPGDRYDNAGEMLQALEEIVYQLRPTPSQADVAAFLARLEAAPEVRPGALLQTPETGTGASATGSAAGADPAPRTASASTATGAASTAGDRPPSGSAAIAPPPAVSAAPAAAAGPAGEVASGLDAEARCGTGTGTGSRSGWAPAAPPAAERDAADDATGTEAPAGAGGGAGKPTDLPGVPVATAGTATTGAGGKRWWRFGSAPAATTPPATDSPRPTAGGTHEPVRTPPDADAERRESTHDRRESTRDRREATHDDERTADRAARAEGRAVARSAVGPAGARPSAEPGAAGAAGGANSASESTATGTPAAPAPLPAITGRAKVDEDDAGRGRWLLVATILLLAVLSLATWLWLERPGRSEARDAAPSADQRLGGEPATVPAVPPVAEEPAAEAAAPQVDLEKLVEEELARQEEEVRRKAEEDYRETARRIQAEIDALRRRQDTPPAPPPADERSTPPPDDSTPAPPVPGPDSAAAGTAAGGGALRVVTSGEAQYPARAQGPWIEQSAARSSTERRG